MSTNEPEGPGPAEAAALVEAVERIAMGIAVTRGGREIAYANAWLRDALDRPAAGVDIADLRGGSAARGSNEIRRAIAAGDPWQGEVELTGAKAARPLIESVYPVPGPEGRARHAVHFFLDLGTLRHAERLGRAAFRDPLTALPNRTLFADRLATAIALAQRSFGDFALVYVDVAHLGRANELVGRKAGDSLLREVAKRLQRAIRAADVLARIAADELAIVAHGVHAQGAVRMIERITRACAGWFEAGEAQHRIGVHAGAAIYPDDGGTHEELLQNAIAAMYRAKAEARAAPLAQPLTGSRYGIEGERT